MLDINKIVQDKINQMHESGEVEKYLVNEVEKLILSSIKFALDGWNIRKEIEKKIETSVSSVVSAIDFTAYNSFIAEKVKQITESELREDVAQTIQEVFNGIFIKKRDNIKLSEIFKAYREWLIDNLDESEQYDLNNEWFADIGEDERCGWLECTISKEEPEKSYLGNSYSKQKCDFSFTISRNYKDKTKGLILLAYFEGINVKDNFVHKHYTNFEALILNLLYNNTPIEIDVEDSDEIDTSLNLDI